MCQGTYSLEISILLFPVLWMEETETTEKLSNLPKVTEQVIPRAAA